jgi:hypothetical protein
MDHMNSTHWQTSTYSGGNGGECIQVAAAPSACSSGIVRTRTAQSSRSSRPRGAASPTALSLNRYDLARLERLYRASGQGRSRKHPAGTD